ncbi:MAG TPA: ABC transporter permease [Candidatus Eisenbacteria bacterium]|nr:ABC transporter permease [Candidatus Eisenbacteria bacterium]
MRAVWAMAAKDLRLLLRDKADLFWILGFPIVLAFFFGSIGSGGGKRAVMPVAVVDQDRSVLSRSIAERLRASDALKAREASYDSARLLVRRGDLVGYVALRPGTGETFGFGGDSTQGVEIGIDPRRRAEREYLRGLVTAAIFQSMQGSFGERGGGRDQIRSSLDRLRSDPGMTAEEKRTRERFLVSLETFLTALDSTRAGGDAEAGGSAGGGPSGPNLRVVEVAEDDTGPRSAFEVTFPSSIAWALIGVCMSFATSLVQERLTGTFLRLRLAPVGRASILAGKGAACFLTAIAAVTIVLSIGIAGFGVRISDPLLLAAAVAASSFCFTGIMLAVSVLGRTPASVSGAGWALMLLLSMTGGGMVPLIAMPEWMQAVSDFSLVKYAVVSVEGAVWRGFGWGEAAPALGVLIGGGLLGAAIGIRVLRTDRG